MTLSTSILASVLSGLEYLNDRALERSDLDQPEAGRGREVLEQGLALGDGDRMGDQPILVDQPEPRERLGEARAPQAIMSLPASRFRPETSSARSPRAIPNSGQSARSMLLENTTFGISFIGAA
jgi:hypothetical protein